MKFGQANIRSLNTSFDTLDTICPRLDFEVVRLSDILHPDTVIINNIKKKWH